MGDRVILHCDLNCFFASVELLSHPDLRDIPTAVCGDPASRHGIILAKNEPAKRLGIQTAETIWQAKKKCPGLVLLPPHHGLYREYSRRVNAIYEQYTDLVEPFGIDESWLDITGSMHLFGGDPKAIADALRRRLRQELGREPVLSELSEASGLTPEEIAQVEIATDTPESLQRETADGLTLEGMLGTDAPEEGMVERIALREAVNQLPEKERMTILLRYFKGLTQERAARVLGVSQVQVSRLERRGLERLRQSFAAGTRDHPEIPSWWTNNALACGSFAVSDFHARE